MTFALRATAATLALAVALAAPVAATATDIGAMSEAERAAFRAEVRDYLLENPEVLMEAIAALEARQAASQAAGDQALVQANADALLNDPASWVGGNPDGSITVVEFADYRCGYCRKAHPEVMQLLQSDGDIRYIVKEFPILGDQSMLASRFAIAVLREAGSDAYARVHDALYTDFRGDVTEASLRRLADDLGLDADRILGAMQDEAVTAVIAANHALAGRLQISGTPTFVIGDQMLRGYVPLDAMQGIVSDERG